MTGFSSSPRFVEHRTSPGHPERPDRIRAIARAVRQAGMIDSPDPFAGFQIELGALSEGKKLLELPEPAPAEEKWLLAVHSPEHVERIRQFCAEGGGMLDEDTPVCPSSYQIARLSAGALLECCDAVVANRVGRAFAAVRPPGHHAEPNQPMGFCLFANVAIAARYLQQRHSVGKIAIVDFDVHHGNGTQAVFESDPSVLFISLHQDPRTCYPGTGYAWEVGKGAGRGFTVNLPFPPGSTGLPYLNAMESLVIPKIESFAPQILLISAGFDAHRDDPLAQINLDEQDFHQMTRMLVDVANVHCGGRVISALEGGYDLIALGRSVVAHLSALAE